MFVLLAPRIFNNIHKGIHKVNRYLARYRLRATTTNQPTNKNANIWPKMTNNAFLGQIWPFFLLMLVQTPNFVFVKKIGRRVKKSSPTPLLGHCLPVTALALRKTHLVFSDKGLHGFMKGGAVYLWFLSRDRMGQLIAIDRQGRQDRNN